MNKQKKKQVNFVIEVPEGDFCYGDGACEYFDNEGGDTRCELGFYGLERDKDLRVLKPNKCKELKEKA